MPDQVLVRPPAVAGTFYPARPDALCEALRHAVAGAQPAPDGAPVPEALIVPHAGYIYSGPIAASAYLRLVPARSAIRRVVLLGPSHRVPLQGMAVPSSSAFATPLGLVPVDDGARRTALSLPAVTVQDLPHAAEHSLEVQLPFLQSVLGSFEVLPVTVGRGRPDEVADVLDALWGGPETVLVVSTDLSHYHPYEEARELDRRTASAIVAADAQAIGDVDACGSHALRGLLTAVRRRRLRVEQIDLRSSGDTAGDHDRVVGYGAFAVG
jgi:AmmeMemoRadiSam system protein B